VVLDGSEPHLLNRERERERERERAFVSSFCCEFQTVRAIPIL
jgi:hypothetical protein